jgi:DNA-directed RNA polymerase specialized sigma24 family protein
MRPAELADWDDLTLLTRARTDDRAAFAQLVRRHQSAALRVAAVICGSTTEAEDIVEDSMVDVHRHLGAYRGTGSVRAWMLRIVANHAKNHVRSRARRVRRDDHHARCICEPGRRPTRSPKYLGPLCESRDIGNARTLTFGVRAPASSHSFSRRGGR